MAFALGLAMLGYVVLLAPVFWYLPTVPAIVVCGILAGIVLLLVRQADLLMYALTNAIALERETYPELYETVDRLAAQADMPRPPVAIVPTDVPNALSAGTGDRTVVCVTLGLIKTLDEDELEAVLAHELAHCKNGDSSVLTVAGFPATVALAMYSLGARHANGLALLLGYFGYALMLVAAAVPLIVVSLPGTLALTRYREYAADRGAVSITGKPVALAEALATLHDVDRKPETDLRGIGHFNAFAIVPSGTGLLTLPRTHPPVHERIRRLRELTADLESSAD